jgi:tetratricopeptide (TPR) repeat protein
MVSLLRRLVTNIRNDEAGRDSLSSARQPSLPPTIEQAIDLHAAGRLDDAERCYLEIIESEPRQFAALCGLAAMYYETGRPAEAIPYMCRAAEIQPTEAKMHANLGAAFLAVGQLDSAQRALKLGLALDPLSDVVNNNLGAVLRALNDVEGARIHFQRACEINPRNAEAFNNLGNIAKESGDLTRAEECFEHAVDLNPQFADAYNNFGSVCHQSGDLTRAEALLMRSLAIQPRSAEALNNLGGVRYDQGDLDGAEQCFRAALTLHPSLVITLLNLGNVLRLMGRLEEAERYCRQAIELDPASATALSNLATVLGQRGDLDAAEEACRAALRADNSCIAAHCNLGSILRQRGQMGLAEDAYKEALRLDPGRIHTQYDLAILALLQDRYEEGFRLYESRFQCMGRDFAATRLSYDRTAGIRQWRGGTLSGLRIFIWSEQGLGDALMMARYVPLLKERGAERITVQCDPALARVMRAIGADEVIHELPDLQANTFDVQCSIMSLPHAFGTRIDTVPGCIPYLQVPEQIRLEWDHRLAGIRHPRIGLAWAGNRNLSDDARRSIPLPDLAPLFSQPGISMISLQKNGRSSDWARLAKDGGQFIHECKDFMDTAALVATLDLVITVDTAVAHLVGAIGHPVWVLNRFGSEWRWGLQRDTTPWYPTLRLFRQESPGDWSGVVGRLVEALGFRFPERGQSSESTKVLS